MQLYVNIMQMFDSSTFFIITSKDKFDINASACD